MAPTNANVDPPPITASALAKNNGIVYLNLFLFVPPGQLFLHCANGLLLLLSLQSCLFGSKSELGTVPSSGSSSLTGQRPKVGSSDE